jgi:branched-chain amino acid transport system permease protein
MKVDIKAPRNRSLLKLIAAAAAILLMLILVPSFVGTYQMQLLI